ncbi:serine threonine kinase [Fusarium pseudocircinatum]|uniref:Serine threonine kinase n=1 Tax=Fusarium pseudocircinatum TaxID=56676 RepID=A0A8H5PHF0_9HYPO|nr:serine threonine kinase [Fusarium pseudocircinatum]
MSELSSNHLKSALKPSLFRQKEGSRRAFVPAKAIDSICKQATIYEHLLRYYIDSDAVKFTEYVCNARKPAREIFCVLVLIDKASYIQRFWNAGVFDDDLPLRSNDQNSELWSRYLTTKRPLLSGSSLEDTDMIQMFC